MDALGGDKVSVALHDTEPLSDEAASADKQFGIKGQQVASRNRGAMSVEEIYMGLAFTSGLEKVVVPFLDRGIPVEYELIRSIRTVAQKERKKVGVLATDARLFGGFNQATMGMSQNEAIIDELEKQYEVKEVRADAPITDDLRRAAGRSAFFAGAGADEELHRLRPAGSSDGHLRRPVPLFGYKRGGHGPAQAAAGGHEPVHAEPAAAAAQGRNPAAVEHAGHRFQGPGCGLAGLQPAAHDRHAPQGVRLRRRGLGRRQAV